MLRDGTIDAAGDRGPADRRVVETAPESLAPVFASVAQQEALSSAVTALGGDPGEVARRSPQASPTVTALEPQPERDAAQIVAGFVAGILLFITAS